jgi:hypothetical protein
LSRPNIPVELPAVLEQDHVEFFMLCKLEFDSATVYISGCDFDVEYDGQIWSSLRGLGQIDAIVESGDEIPGINLTLSGVPNESIVHAQTEQYRGRKVTLLWVFFDGDIPRVDPACWQGRMDIPIITRGADTCTIQVTAENRMIDWQRTRGLLFNHADQQRVLEGDNFFLGIESMVEQEVTLFKAETFTGGGYGAGNLTGGGGVSNLLPETPPSGVTYNVDIINAYREYYGRRPDIDGYKAFSESGLYGSALMIAILAASAPSGIDYDAAIARGYDPNNASSHYFASVVHPADGSDWVAPSVDGSF